MLSTGTMITHNRTEKKIFITISTEVIHIMCFIFYFLDLLYELQ